MKIITTLEDLYSDKPCAVAIGKFDGVHLGHRKLLDVILASKKQGLQSAVFTFEPSPEALFGMGDVRVLSTQEEKRARLEALGIDLLVEYPMNFQTAAVEPEMFIREYLVKRLKAGLVAAGEDLSYGDKGKGDFKLLESLKLECGYETACVEKLRVDGEIVSSSYIRWLIAAGKMQEAMQMLGGAYSLSGIVAHGRGLGHTIGFPTVNLYPSSDKALPPFGVYRSLVRIGEDPVGNGKPETSVHFGAGGELLPGVAYPAITNIGVRPTVSEEGRISAETYLYDFDGDLYGRALTIELLEFTRPEQHFDNVEGLIAQLKKDIADGRKKEGS